MRCSLLFQIFLVTSLLLAVTPYQSRTYAVSYVPGVNVGDWWNYGPFEISCANCTSTSADVIAFTFLVTTVSGSDVALKGTAALISGDKAILYLSGNLATGSGNLTEVPPLIATGLGPGDSIFNSPSAPRINYTTTRTYAGAVRQVNVVNNTSPSYGNMSQTLYYDQLTGINVEVSQSAPGFSIHILLTGTNLWPYHVAIPDDPSCSPNNLAPCGFIPLEARVVVGSTVEWDNVGVLTHAVASCSGGVTSERCPSGNNPSLPTFSSGAIQPGSSYALGFNTIGIYRYYDPMNVGMKALIAVQGNATTPPDFSISIDPPSLTLVAGSSGYADIIVAGLNGFLGYVTLASSFPSQANYPVIIGPSATGRVEDQGLGFSFGTQMIVRTDLNTIPGVYKAVVTGASGPIVHAVEVVISILPSTSTPDFAISANPGFLTIPAGTSANSIISLSSVNGFSGTVFLSTAPSPPCPAPSCSSWSISPGGVVLASNGTTTATLSIFAGTEGGQAFGNITVLATSGPLSHSVTVSFATAPSPSDFGVILSAPPGGVFVIAGQTTVVGVGIFSLGPVFFNGTVTLTGQVFPYLIDGPQLSFSPSQLSLVPPGPSTSVLTISTTSATPPGNYSITITWAGGTLVHSAQILLSVLPPPVLTLSPSSGTLGTRVSVHGSGFPSPRGDPFGFPVQVLVTFDDQFLGITYIETGEFDFVFNTPHAQPGLHQIHAIQQYPVQADVTAYFTILPDPERPGLEVDVSVGTIYFPGETATIFVQATIDGRAATVSSLGIVVLRPDGSSVTLNAEPLATGVYKASYAIPRTNSLGTYAVFATAHLESSDASTIGSFQVKPSWLQANGPRIATTSGIVGAVGIVGVLAVAWRKGYFVRRKDNSRQAA